MISAEEHLEVFSHFLNDYSVVHDDVKIHNFVMSLEGDSRR